MPKLNNKAHKAAMPFGTLSTKKQFNIAEYYNARLINCYDIFKKKHIIILPLVYNSPLKRPFLYTLLPKFLIQSLSRSYVIRGSGLCQWAAV